MPNDVISLVHTVETVDEYGDPCTREEKREVFAEVRSIGQSEFYQASATGLMPEVKFGLADYFDYAGEQLVEHEGVRYRVLRTYRKNNSMELTCYREVNPP